MDDLKNREASEVSGGFDREGTTRKRSAVVAAGSAKLAARAASTGRTRKGRPGDSNLGLRPPPAARAVDRVDESTVGGSPTQGQLAWSINQVADSLGIGRRTLEREIAAGRFPRADFRIGKMPRWRPATVRAWVESR